MGLIKAAKDAIGSVMSDQWREYFYCDALSNDILVAKGQKKGKDDNIISNGSVIAVNEGQCMMIVEQGEIVEFCAEAGEFVYDTSTEPSLFYGSLGENVKKTFSNIGRRFTFGGNTPKDQRIYYFNIKEVMGNKFGTAVPIPFRIVDTNIGLDIDTSVRCNGEYSFKIVDPLLFYKNVCGNVSESFVRDEMASQMKSELVTALQPALAQISAAGIRYSALPSHTKEIAEHLNEEMNGLWRELRGVEVISMNMSAPAIPEEDQAMIQEMQRRAVMRTAGLDDAYLKESQAEAFRNMGKKIDGAGSGDVMGAAMSMMAMNMMDNMIKNGQTGGQADTAASDWTCSCGTVNHGKFCTECGNKRS